MSDNFHRVKHVPIIAPENEWLFNLDLATEEIDLDGKKVKTGFLRPGLLFSLLAVGQTTSLLETGMMDVTDAIDPAMSLAEIAIAFNHNGKSCINYHPLQTENGMEVGAQLSASPQSNYRVIELNYAGMIKIQSKDGSVVNTIGVSGAGHCNLELGDTEIHFNVTNQEDADFTDVRVVGYKLNAQRVNYNRRAA